MENKGKKFLNKKRGRNPNARNGHLNNRNKPFNKSSDKNKENVDNEEKKKDNFNTGDFKKKYNKEYILSQQKPKIGRKFEKKKQNSEEENINHNNLNLTLSENLFKKAKEIYDKKSEIYDTDNPDALKNKDLRWTANMLKTGTLEDKISSISLLVKKDPKLTLKYIDLLLKMSKKKNRRHSEICINALKDLFLSNILTNKKLLNFIQSTQNNPNFSDEDILEFYIDDFVHKKYLEFVEVVEEIIKNDPLKNMKKKYMNLILEMLARRPEREEKLMEVLVNKLGDPDVEICTHAIKLLKNLQVAHMKMSIVILRNVENFMGNENLNNNSKFYSLVFLCQMENYSNKDFLQYSINFFFDLFNLYTSKPDEENWVKHMSLVIKKISSLMKFCHEHKIKTNDLIREKINTFFRLSHSESLKLRIQVLRLIFNIVKYETSNTDSNNSLFKGKGKINPHASNNSKEGKQEIPEDQSFLNRYYKSLYEIILCKEITNSKYLKDFLKLTIESLLFDTFPTRVSAFIKRLLSVCYCAEPPFICCVLVIISQVLRHKNKIWKVLETPLNKNNTIKFDDSKRDPLYTNADDFPLHELTILSNHYHPTVQKFSKFILENYKKETISYEGDPLIDFSLINFLEKFILKNPKIKKDKKQKKTAPSKSQAEIEDEEFRRFIGDDVDADNETNEKEESGENFDFITKFGEFEKISGKQTKKSKNKGKDIEDFADGVMEDEYEKYENEHGGDVDDDIDFDNEDIE